MTICATGLQRPCPAKRPVGPPFDADVRRFHRRSVLDRPVIDET